MYPQDIIITNDGINKTKVIISSNKSESTSTSINETHPIIKIY